MLDLMTLTWHNGMLVNTSELSMTLNLCCEQPFDSRAYLCNEVVQTSAVMSELWASKIAGENPQKRSNTSVTGATDKTKMDKLLVVTAKLGLKNAREVATMAAVVFRTVRVEAASELVQAASNAIQGHIEATRGK
eukprot:27218-Amphidinium_carterae.1